MGCRDLHQNRDPAVGGRCSGAVSSLGRLGAGQSQGVAVESTSRSTALAGSLGKPQELSSQRRLGRAPDAGRNGARDFHGERRTNDTDASTTDRMPVSFAKAWAKKRGCGFIGHAVMENRKVIVGAVTTRPSGHAERLAALR